MKKRWIIPLIFMVLAFAPYERSLTPYVKVGELDGSMTQVMNQVNIALSKADFQVLGTYHPGGKASLGVVAFTRNDLKNTVARVKDRGALAAVLKVGLVKKNGKVTVSYTRPEYIFRAYLRDAYGTYASTLKKVESDLQTALSSLGSEFTGFGGSVPAGELKKYHYKVMMPYFTDPVILKKFSSFDEGLNTIEKNLRAGKSSAVKVYSLIYKSKNIAVFGVGISDASKGEAHFLPVIGESHVAAMPYEIILQGNTATMLHGRYRLALFWPELSMGTFMKIVSTPGDIEDTMKALCE